VRTGGMRRRTLAPPVPHFCEGRKIHAGPWSWIRDRGEISSLHACSTPAEHRLRCKCDVDHNQ
jgi:hypothetical protein